MQTWWRSSPFTSVGIYIGGANRGCAQPNLTAPWVNTVIAQGWRLLPIWVGPQAPCSTLSTTKLSLSVPTATNQGLAEGKAAADRAAALGLGWLAPVYYDMESYPAGGACSKAVQAFTNGWTYALNQRGYLAGYYSSLCSGIADQAATVTSAAVRAECGLDRGVEQHTEHLRVQHSGLFAVRRIVVGPLACPPVHRRPRRDLGRSEDQHRQQRGRRADLPLVTPYDGASRRPLERCSLHSVEREA